MTGDVPPGAQCTHDGCEREAVDPDHPAGFCERHLPDKDDQNGERGEDDALKGSSPDDTPTPETDKRSSADLSDGELWGAAGFADPEPSVWPSPHTDRDQWMARKSGDKAPWAPWADDDAPVACNHGDHDEPATCEDCEHSAAFKWGSDGSREHVHTDAETAREWASKHPEANGDLVYIQREDSPLGFVDGDDVRCPETGEVHPAFVAILEHLGLTYADVSTSKSGVHAAYIGDIPIEGEGQASFEIDTEPWGANDSVPTIEIYTNKHVCVMTGDHVPGTPTEATEWDSDALRAILEAAGYSDDDQPDHDTDKTRPSLEGYEPTATTSTETTSEIKDVFAAVDGLSPRDVFLKTTRTGADSTGWSTWDPSYRSSESGESLHYNGEGAFYDHKEGKSFGVLGLLAAERKIIQKPWGRLAGGDWWEAIEEARDDGADIPEYEPQDTEPKSAVPLALLDKLDEEEAQRVARNHGIEWPDTREARRRLRDRLLTAMRNQERAVLDAPTALGKSYTTATEPWRTRASATGQHPVIHLHETREARDQAAAHSKEAAVDYRVLLGRTEACPVAGGEHDPKEEDGDNDRQIITIDGTPASEWFEAVCEGRGVPFSVAHRYLDEHNDQDADLPCCADDTQCLAIGQWDDVPRDDNGDPAADVIHATHQFAMVPSLRTHANLVFDERPDFEADLSTRRVQEIVTAYLQHIDAPVTTWETFVAVAQSSSSDPTVGREQDATEQAIQTDPEREWYLSDPNAHTIAPALTRALWYALRDDQDTNGRHSATVPHEPPRLDAQANDDDGWNRVWLSVVLDSDHSVRTIRTAPDMSAARSVIGLDAHPTPELWQANLGESMTLDRVLDVEERRLWRRLERQLTVVQVGDATRPFTSGEYFNPDATEEFVRALRDRFDDGFGTAVTAGSVEDEHREILTSAGVSDPETMHFGEEKSRDDFATERVGFVNGCIDPGDDYVLDLLAELGLDAEPELVECGTCGGSGCTSDPDCRDGYRRAHGREFVGDDADSASALLASVRENHVAQAAGRYARDASGDSGAVVFVRTDATPPGYVDLQVPGVEWVPTDTQGAIIEELAARPSATASELADAVGCTKEHVRNTLSELHERDVVQVSEEHGDHGAHLYKALAGIEGGAGVELEADTTNDDVWVSYTWSLAVSPPTSAANARTSSPKPTGTVDRPDMQAGLSSFGDDPPPE